MKVKLVLRTEYSVLRKENIMGIIKSFKQLSMWQKGMLLVKQVYRLTKEFPGYELYGLTSQTRRAAVSIPTNIAEGFRRRSRKEFKQFLYIALGSLAELETELLIAEDLFTLSSIHIKTALENIDHICRMISNMLKRL